MGISDGLRLGPKAIDTELASAVGFRIVRRRKALGLTQREVAAHIGYTTAAIGHLEGGTHMPSCSQIPKLCRALRMTPNELFGWEDQ